MIQLRRFLSVLHARNLEFIRDKGTLVWNFVFPFLVVIVFSFAFSGKNQDLFKVAWIGVPESAQSQAFKETRHIQFVVLEATQQQDAIAKLRRHQYDLVVAGSPQGVGVEYWVNDSNPKGYLSEQLLLGRFSESGGEIRAQKRTVEGREIRYVDWVISGLLAMNMMFSALFGVGYVIVRYRKIGVLKRFKVTPLHAFEFLTAQVVSRLGLIVLTSVIVYAGCNALIDFHMEGSYFDLFVVLTLGAVCLISLGLLVAARLKSEEVAGGLLNLLTWPMMFLSGVWFSLEGAPQWLQGLAKVFPLTHVIDAARAVMTEGATLGQIQPQLWVLGVLSVIFVLVGTLIFKWE
jgi:ABC-2 type transport system permease protein